MHYARNNSIKQAVQPALSHCVQSVDQKPYTNTAFLLYHQTLMTIQSFKRSQEGTTRCACPSSRLDSSLSGSACRSCRAC